VAFSGAPDPAMMQAARGPLAATWSAEGLDVPDDLGLFDDLYLHPWPEALGCRPHAENTVDSWHMGFDGGDADPPPWVYSLGADRPCVYVSFGTEVGRLAPWPAILAALGALDVDGVITTGQGIDLSEHGTVPPNVRVETYVPQGYVLDRASLMVTHAGAGAVAAALERSLPHLCLPIAADQWENADACAAAGIASRLEPDARSADDVGHAISTLLTDAMVLQRCRRVRHQVAAMPAVTDAADRVEALVV
jgi:MGT family glycosyltransferase